MLKKDDNVIVTISDEISGTGIYISGPKKNFPYWVFRDSRSLFYVKKCLYVAKTEYKIPISVEIDDIKKGDFVYIRITDKLHVFGTVLWVPISKNDCWEILSNDEDLVLHIFDLLFISKSLDKTLGL